VGNEILEGGCIESFSGVIKCGIVDIIDGRCKLVVCDGGHNKVGVPCFLFGEVGCSCLFAYRSSGGGVDGILGGNGHGNGERGPVALKVEDRVLEEAKMSISVSPRARNGHEVGI
jgi:hypothetical protein